ncbi:unnamed protein product, partial [Urochloa humidicola]
CRRAAEAAVGEEAGETREAAVVAVLAPLAPVEGEAVGAPRTSVSTLPTAPPAEAAVAVAIAAGPRRQAPPREAATSSPRIRRQGPAGEVATLPWLRDSGSSR